MAAYAEWWRSTITHNSCLSKNGYSRLQTIGATQAWHGQSTKERKTMILYKIGVTVAPTQYRVLARASIPLTVSGRGAQGVSETSC